MAKIKLSAIAVTDIRGKAGGTVFSKNKGGAYFKNFAIPTNPKTLAQQAVRAMFGAISQMWSTLTQAQRNGWKELASNRPYTDIFGDTKYLSGFNLFQQLNSNLSNTGQTLIQDDPGISPVVSISSIASEVFEIGNVDFNATVNFPALAGVNGVTVLEVTPPLPAGVSNFAGKFTKLNQVSFTSGENSTDLNASSYSDYVAKYGVPTIGSVIGIRVHNVTVDGYASTRFESSVTVDA